MPLTKMHNVKVLIVLIEIIKKTKTPIIIIIKLHKMLQHSIKSTTLKGDRAFAVRAPRLWNDPPEGIRLAESVTSFKSLLKTHF